MTAQIIRVERSIAAEPAVVYRLLDDSASWPSWTPIDSFELLEPPGADGTGEVRLFRNGRYRLREQIVERVPDRRLSYTLLSGLAVRDYRADIDLAPGVGETRVQWRTTFSPKLPGTGRLYRRALQQATEAFVAGLAAAVTPAGRLR